MMELRNSIGFISRMNPLIIYIGKILFLDPIIQYSTIPTARIEIDGTPLWGETKARSSGRGFFTIRCAGIVS